MNPEPRSCWRATSLQKALVLASLKQPDRAVFHHQHAIRLPMGTTAELAQKAWRVVTRRHSILRAQLACRGSGVEMHLLNHALLEPGFRVTTANDPGALARAFAHEYDTPFAFDSGLPLWRALYLRCGKESYLCLTFHHAITDQRTIDLLLQDLDEALRHKSDALPEAAEFTAYLEWLENQDFDYLKEKWQNYAAPLTELTQLPADGVDDNDRTEVRLSASLDSAISAEVRAFAARHELTPNQVLIGAWALVLSRLSFQDVVSFGVVRAGRANSLPGSETIAGPFLKTLPFIMPVPTEATVLDYLWEVRRRWQFLYEVEHCPVEQLLEWTPQLAGDPLLCSLYNYLRSPAQAYGALEIVHVRRSAPLEPTLGIVEGANFGIDVVAPAAHERFSRIAAETFPVVVRQLIRHDGLLGSIGLGVDRRDEILKLGQGPLSPSDATTLAAWVDAAFVRHGEHCAIDGAESRSFAELDRETRTLAAQLPADAEDRERVVALVLPAGRACVTAILALTRSGRPFLCLNPDVPVEELRTILGVAVPAGVVTTEKLADELGDPRWDSVSWESIVSQPEKAALPPGSMSPGHLAYLVHTSGTTGQPKIIQIEQHSAANLISAIVPVYKLGPGERRFQLSQPGPDFFIAEILLTFCSGATLVLPAKREVFAPGDFLAQLERDRISLAGIPSSYWRELVRYFARKGEAILPGYLRLLIVGMEAVDSSALEEWNRLAPERLELLNVYGPSETTMITTVYALRQGVPPGETLVPIGRPIANTAMYVLDQHGQLLPPGAVGEMAIAGAGVMRGYKGGTGGQPQPNPHDTRPSFARLYRTGDFGHLRTDGNFVFAGRRDGQVKIRGHRIELVTVEKHLAQAADGAGVAALAVRRGERQMLVGVVEADGAPDPDTIRQRLRASAREALIPAAILFISPFPRLPNGKIDRRELQRHAERELASPTSRSAPIGGSLQERMIAVWNEVFETEACSPDSHFFALGGDSLLAVRLSLMAEERLGRPLPLGHLYAHPTLRELVEKLDDRSETPRSLLVPLARGTGQAPLFAFHGWGGRIFVWPNLARHLAGERDCWGIQGHEHIGQAIPRTMREICQTYAAAIHQQDHGGPVVLIGHSLGAIIAYETARYFAARGGRIQRVVLLDPPPPNSLAGLFRRSVLSPVGRRLPALKQLLRKARYGSLLQTSSPMRETHAQLEVDYYKPLLTAHFPKRSELPILYIHCEDGRTRPPFAWRRLFDGPCDTACIATSHHNMVAEPALSEIAHIIRART